MGISSESRPSGLVETIRARASDDVLPPGSRDKPGRGVRSFGQPVRGQPIVPVEDEPVGRSLAEQRTDQVSAAAPDPPTSMVGRLHPEHVDSDPHASPSLGLARSKRWPVAVRAFGLETGKTWTL